MKIPVYVTENLERGRDYTLAFLRWLALGLLAGAACGLSGAAFSHCISFVKGVRLAHGWLIFLLPAGGLLSVLIYKLLGVSELSTNNVLEAVRTEKPVSLLLAPAVFAGTLITHFFGGSAGKEGAALQLGGSISTLVAKVLRLDEKSRHVITMSCMGGLFSAVFGTPLGACVFAVEVVRVGQICSAALFPTLVCSVTAYGIAGALGVSAERFHIADVPAGLQADVLLKVAVLAIAGAAVSCLFCHAMHISGKLFARYFKNPFIRIAVGALTVVVLSLIFGVNEYNGDGLAVIERVFEEGTVRPEAFILKLIFTVITIGCGFKGGEIVPSFFIGTTLGGSAALLLGIPVGLGAAVGMAAMFCGVTNCPLATCFLCAEMFGGQGLIYLSVSAFISFILSGYASLYSGQRLMFSKLDEEIIDNG